MCAKNLYLYLNSLEVFLILKHNAVEIAVLYAVVFNAI